MSTGIPTDQIFPFEGTVVLLRHYTESGEAVVSCLPVSVLGQRLGSDISIFAPFSDSIRQLKSELLIWPPEQDDIVLLFMGGDIGGGRIGANYAARLLPPMIRPTTFQVKATQTGSGFLPTGYSASYHGEQTIGMAEGDWDRTLFPVTGYDTPEEVAATYPRTYNFYIPLEAGEVYHDDFPTRMQDILPSIATPYIVSKLSEVNNPGARPNPDEIRPDAYEASSTISGMLMAETSINGHGDEYSNLEQSVTEITDMRVEPYGQRQYGYFRYRVTQTKDTSSSGRYIKQIRWDGASVVAGIISPHRVGNARLRCRLDYSSAILGSYVAKINFHTVLPEVGVYDLDDLVNAVVYSHSVQGGGSGGIDIDFTFSPLITTDYWNSTGYTALVITTECGWNPDGPIARAQFNISNILFELEDHDGSIMASVPSFGWVTNGVW